MADPGEQTRLLASDTGSRKDATAGQAAATSRVSSGGSSSGSGTHYASVSLDDDDPEQQDLPAGDAGELRPLAPVSTRHSGTRVTFNGSRTWRSFLERVDSFFLISARGSSVGQELRAGAVTFVTCAYIVVVNAAILSKSGVDPATGESLHFDAVVLATALSSVMGCALVGLMANLPFALAPGMGLNSYFTFGVCLRLGMSWRVALTCCFMQGILFMLLSVLGACELLQQHAPLCIKKGVTVGLGLFQALVGFELMQLVVPGKEVLLALGDVTRPELWIALAGMMLICALMTFKIKGAMLIGMVCITCAAWLMNPDSAPQGIAALPSLQAHPLSMLDFAGFFHHAQQSIMVTCVMLFVAVFDTAGVQYLCGSGAGLLDAEDRLPGAKAAFFAAGASTSFGALLGTSPIIIHNETFAGIADGARTGLHSVMVSLLFLVTLPFVPLLRAVPPIATAAPLVIVGMHMMGAARFIRWGTVHEAMPAFLCAAILPLTYSIANGMLFGLGAYAVLIAAHKLSGQPEDDEEEQQEEANAKRLQRNGSDNLAAIAAGPPPGTPRLHRSDCTIGHCSCGVCPSSMRRASSAAAALRSVSPTQTFAHTTTATRRQGPQQGRGKFQTALETGGGGRSTSRGRAGEPSPSPVGQEQEAGAAIIPCSSPLLVQQRVEAY